ncbi:nitroreductase family protein [Bacteroides sp.]|uniref:nitroreductase family protein n=1 Tax=Bacteroides sp. TaxID=29523 RepID=UPI00260D39C6|nr:nitroreductase family protein [Bacteroides sp.]MDD3036327.1 nitroreductase family protein [Bacteroides sp.]
MERTFSEALKHRRTYYSITNQSPILDEEIECIINTTVRNVPSAFNSQTTRIVLLLGDSHKKLWQIVKDTLEKIMPQEAFVKTEEKIDNSFACGYGTVLFFEDQLIVKELQNTFPAYQDKFPEWSLQTSGMHQFVIWTMLEDAGLGASLQHYNPLIDDEVRRTWHLPENWHLIAEMPFGTPTQRPGEKEYLPLEERVKIFR